MLPHAPHQELDAILPEERLAGEHHRRHAPVAGRFERLLIFGDHGVVAAGANQVSGVRFGIKDDSGLRAQAMQQAVQKSRPQANAIAAGLGLKTDQVLEIREEPTFSPVGVAADAAQRGGGVPIEPGQLTARVRVQVTFALVPGP